MRLRGALYALPLPARALRLEPRDCHVADVVDSRDLDQRLTAASGRFSKVANN
jgi:hypothetical protein